VVGVGVGQGQPVSRRLPSSSTARTANTVLFIIVSRGT